MLAVFILFFAVWFAFTAILDASLTKTATGQAIAMTRNMMAHDLAENVRQYYLDNGSFPADAATLAATSGYEHVRTLVAPWQNMALSGALTDSVWQYRRVAVWTQNPRGAFDDATYLSAANNSCGTGTFAAATDWCGPSNSLWWKMETRLNFASDLIKERQRQQRVLSRLVDVYNEREAFPAVGGAYATLASLVGYGGTARNCSGVYTWSPVGFPPISFNCEELFTRWGTPVALNYFSDQHIALAASSSIVTAGGQTISVSTDLDLDRPET